MICCWCYIRHLIYNKRRYQCTATCKTQTLLALRWLIDATPVHHLAHDNGISQATAYRYLHEAVEVISFHAPACNKY